MSDSERRNKTVNKQVRMTPDEYQEIKSKADAFGLSIPQFLRDCAMDRALKSRADLLAIRELSNANANQGRLGGLLKLWLTGEHQSHKDHAQEIRILLNDIQASQKLLEETILNLAGITPSKEKRRVK